VPDAIKQYFSYSNNATLLGRDDYSLASWQSMLRDQFDLGWPVYYSGFSNDGGHAFVCDGYNDEDLFHFNWGWGGSSDGWFVIDEIDFSGGAQAIFNFVPSDVYDYMPLQPENLSVTPSGDFDYSATIQWTNPTKNIHSSDLTVIDQIVVTRNGEIIYTEDNVAPGITMSYIDQYMPAVVSYGVYAVVHNAKSLLTLEEGILLGPTCTWTVEMNSSDNQGWHEGSLSFVNEAGDQLVEVTLESASATQTISLPLGHVDIIWNKSKEAIDNIKFQIKNSAGVTKVDFDGVSTDLGKGLFYIANNTCDNQDEESDGPTALSVQIADNRASLRWEAPVGIDVINYHVYRDNVLHAVTTDRSYIDDQAMDAYHNYYVTAFTNHGETVASNTIDIVPESDYAYPTNLRYEMITPTKVKVMWDAPEGVEPSCYFLFRRVKGQEFKRIKLVAHTYYNDNINSQANDRYEYAVSAFYSDDNSHSIYAPTQADPALHCIQVNKTIIPQNLCYTIPDENVILHWKGASMAEAYNIYRDGQLIGETSDTEFIDYEATSSNDYHYTVTGKTAFLESNPSNMVQVDWSTMEVNSHSQNLSIYPNPAEDKVVIEGIGISQVRIFNMMGQEILNRVVDQDRVVIDLASQPSGFYFIEVVSEQGLETSKLLKK
jgi:fibronectin type 3 domain-containing protein